MTEGDSQNKLYYQIAGEDHALFMEKLSKATGWKRERASRAIQEYLKFVFLTKKYGPEQVPSKPVDEVWHLHLQFTKDYWEEFCPKFVGFDLHHIPTPKTPEARQAGIEKYLETLERYQIEFGEPPKSFWPRPFTPEDQSLVRSAMGALSVFALVGVIVSFVAFPDITFLPSVNGRQFLLGFGLLIFLDYLLVAVLLLGTRNSEVRIRNMALLSVCGLWILTVIIGVLRLLHGINNGYPVGGLVTLLALFGFVLPLAVRDWNHGIGSGGSRNDWGGCTSCSSCSSCGGGGCGGCSS